MSAMVDVYQRSKADQVSRGKLMSPFFTPPPVETPREATVSEVKTNLRRTVDDASRGTETLVTRHNEQVAAVVSVAAYRTLAYCRRAAAQEYESCHRRLSHIRDTPEKGMAPPSSTVVDLMEEILRRLEAVLAVGPDRVVRAAGGGVDTYFFSAEKKADGSPVRYVCVGVDEDADATVVFSQSPDYCAADDLTPEIDFGALAARITDFLSGADQPQPTAEAGTDT